MPTAQMGNSPIREENFVPNVLQLYNDELKDIFKVRVNPVMTIGGLKQRIADKY